MTYRIQSPTAIFRQNLAGNYEPHAKCPLAADLCEIAGGAPIDEETLGAIKKRFAVEMATGVCPCRSPSVGDRGTSRKSGRRCRRTRGRYSGSRSM
jgi:hypothetical protein